MSYRNRTMMPCRAIQCGNVCNKLFLNKIAMSALVAAMAIATAAVAEETVEEDTQVFHEQSVETGMDNDDVRVLASMANHAGITLTPETIKRMLATHPEITDGVDSGQRDAFVREAAAIYPARFEVTGQATIYEDTLFNLKSAGGRFTAAGIDVLLNYSSVLGGVSYENMALWGSSHSNQIEAKLAVDAEFEAYGVYGRADAGPPPFPAVTYGVYGTTNQPTGYGVYAINTAPQGDAANDGGGVALFATGNINGLYTSGGIRAMDNHVAIIENTVPGGLNAHVLALSMPNETSPGGADNFITFYAGGETETDAVGSIEGNSAGGVVYKTSGADFAEWIPRKNLDEPIETGDVVGIAGGKVSRNLKGFDHIQVISTAPGFAGNAPGDDKIDQYALVAMMGQVPVKVSGAVKAGDYIVASGRNDGAGIAIQADKMRPEDFRMMVGRAWESSDDLGIKLVDTAVGFGASDVYAYMRKQDQRIASLEQQLSAKMAHLDRLAAQTEILSRKVASIQSANMVVKSAMK